MRWTLSEARELHASLEVLDALTNTAGGKVGRDLEAIRPPFTDLREALDGIMHAEAQRPKGKR